MSDPKEVAKRLVESAGRLMHESWSATKRAEGFHGPTEPCPHVSRNADQRECEFFHADLVDWNDLPERQKDINRNAYLCLAPLFEEKLRAYGEECRGGFLEYVEHAKQIGRAHGFAAALALIKKRREAAEDAMRRAMDALESDSESEARREAFELLQDQFEPYTLPDGQKALEALLERERAACQAAAIKQLGDTAAALETNSGSPELRADLAQDMLDEAASFRNAAQNLCGLQRGDRHVFAQGKESPGWCANCGKHRSLHRGQEPSGCPEWCPDYVSPLHRLEAEAELRGGNEARQKMLEVGLCDKCKGKLAMGA